MTSNDETVMDRRCVEPRFLAGWAERTLSILVLRKFLDAVGHCVTLGIIEEDAVWLSDRGLGASRGGGSRREQDGAAGLARTLDPSTDIPQ